MTVEEAKTTTLHKLVNIARVTATILPLSKKKESISPYPDDRDPVGNTVVPDIPCFDKVYYLSASQKTYLKIKIYRYSRSPNFPYLQNRSIHPSSRPE